MEVLRCTPDGWPESAWPRSARRCRAVRCRGAGPGVRGRGPSRGTGPDVARQRRHGSTGHAPHRAGERSRRRIRRGRVPRRPARNRAASGSRGSVHVRRAPRHPELRDHPDEQPHHDRAGAVVRRQPRSPRHRVRRGRGRCRRQLHLGGAVDPRIRQPGHHGCRRGSELGAPGQPRLQPRHRRLHDVEPVPPGEPVPRRDLELARRLLWGLLRTAPVRPRRRRPPEHGQLRAVHGGRHGLHPRQPRAQPARRRAGVGAARAERPPEPAGDRRHARLRERHGGVQRAGAAHRRAGQQRRRHLAEAHPAQLQRVPRRQRALHRPPRRRGEPHRPQRLRPAGARRALRLPGAAERGRRMAPVLHVHPGGQRDPRDHVLAHVERVRDRRRQLVRDGLRHVAPGRPSGARSADRGIRRAGLGRPARPRAGNHVRLVRDGGRRHEHDPWRDAVGDGVGAAAGRVRWRRTRSDARSRRAGAPPTPADRGR